MTDPGVNAVFTLVSVKLGLQIFTNEPRFSFKLLADRSGDKSVALAASLAALEVTGCLRMVSR